MLLDFFNCICDKIYIISLKDRIDRQESIIQNLSLLGLKKDIDYSFYLVDKHPEGSVYGSFTSHINVIKDYYQHHQMGNILILEDDAYFELDKINLQKLQEICYFIRNNKSWDLFYLGGMMTYKYPDLDNYQYIIKGEWIMVHSYIVNYRCMKYIINHREILPSSFSFTDYHYNLLHKLNKYGLNRSICFQTDSPSTNSWPIYLNTYKFICNLLNILWFHKTDVYVMIILSELFFKLLPTILLKYIDKYKYKFNKFRYRFYLKNGKKISKNLYHYLPPL